jgi:O-methyltransferase
MNLAYPEKCALAYFWPKLITGAAVVFDDYAWIACREQKAAHDAFAASQGCEILTLPDRARAAFKALATRST